MAQKRSRATFEADNYAVYGTPLPAYDPDARDDGSYVPIWKQEVVDERGRKRLHGAFTGGFSAGYFNTVGSKEGWTPQTFVSSRTNRAKDQNKTAQQRPEDFMDEEDLAAQEDDKVLQTNDSFTGIGSTADDNKRRGVLMDLVRPKVSIGVKLLQKMGWREGQGVGQKIKRKARLGENGDHNGQEHAFAPENTKMIAFIRKTDQKGLGFAGEQSLREVVNPEPAAEDDADEAILARSRVKLAKDPKPRKKTGFGMGVLNDTGSDDEDPYEIGPKISYNRTVGAVRKAKKVTKPGGLVSASSNPLISTKPVFVSKKKLLSTNPIRKCHDGRLPLTGFVLSTKPLDFATTSNHPPPKVPPDWVSTKIPLSSTAAPSSGSQYKSTADAARASTLDPHSRATLLGETALPGKSIFDYLTPAARERLASATGIANLPAAGSEAPPSGLPHPSAASLVPHLDPALARSALARFTAGSAAGFTPYADDPPKRTRYASFLDHAAGTRKDLPPRREGAGIDEWVAEMREFVQAAQVFRPMSGLMASRFTSSSGSTNTVTQKKVQDPAEEAAKMRMFGPLTRSVRSWMPAKLLCKRFGVRVPDVEMDDGEEKFAGGRGMETGMESGMGSMSMALTIPAARAEETRSMPETTMKATPVVALPTPTSVDVERNIALEAERPGEAVFKAIFGSDDEDEDD
ncbi:DUF1604-domain-containing protein [Microthyrium microscopicum]|uniref:DUF1604-domain-containing protein n=1 Tax=Microthyrium microscopicum TaxID=703497 RepID=A0A6A6U6R4_9PEZI|nr:DUF1604-domain-containing protein [Microthyrium microscopicum]